MVHAAGTVVHAGEEHVDEQSHGATLMHWTRGVLPGRLVTELRGRCTWRSASTASTVIAGTGEPGGEFDGEVCAVGSMISIACSGTVDALPRL